ncbi:Nucleolar protein 6 [Aix galericulata]|nr:Nucleolar protein 6 [Aix galericulata]
MKAEQQEVMAAAAALAVLCGTDRTPGAKCCQSHCPPCCQLWAPVHLSRCWLLHFSGLSACLHQVALSCSACCPAGPTRCCCCFPLAPSPPPQPVSPSAGAVGCRWQLSQGCVGFLCFLNLLVTFDWNNKPFIINLNAGLTDVKCTKIKNKFVAIHSRLPIVFISTPQRPVQLGVDLRATLSAGARQTGRGASKGVAVCTAVRAGRASGESIVALLQLPVPSVLITCLRRT